VGQSNAPMGIKGLTLIELLVVIAIAAIFIGASLPSFLSLIQRSHIDAAARQVLSEMRTTQSLAVSRGGVFGFHWGGDPLVGMAPTFYRLEVDGANPCTFPAPADTTVTNPNVIRDWFDLASEFPGVTIQSVTDNVGTVLGGVMFNSRGASVNTCAAVTFPVTVIIADTSGSTRTIQIQRAGRAAIQ
jgi:prepilin-type N-terminal cleavage/methylation domain-containing protein